MRSIERQGAQGCYCPQRAVLQCLARCKREVATFTVPPWRAMPELLRSPAVSVKPIKQNGNDVRPKERFDYKMGHALFQCVLFSRARF